MNEVMPIRLIIPDYAVVDALARGNLLDLLVKLDPDAVLVFNDVVVHEAMNGQDNKISERLGGLMRTHAPRIQIDTTAFGNLIESAKQDATIRVLQPPPTCRFMRT